MIGEQLLLNYICRNFISWGYYASEKNVHFLKAGLWRAENSEFYIRRQLFWLNFLFSLDTRTFCYSSFGIASTDLPSREDTNCRPIIIFFRNYSNRSIPEYITFVAKKPLWDCSQIRYHSIIAYSLHLTNTVFWLHLSKTNTHTDLSSHTATI